jgi:hypothetical protein
LITRTRACLPSPPTRWTPCRLWQRHTDIDGYAIASTLAGPRPALHVIFERDRGPMPAGLVFDRLCGERACVHLDHARLTMRADLINPDNNAPSKVAHRAGVCQRGHPMPPENTSITKRSRQCRICKNATQRAYYARTQMERQRRQAEGKGAHEAV